MSRLWGKFKRLLGVTEYYERGGSKILVMNSRRTFKDESYEKWLIRLDLNPNHPGLASYYKSLYEQDYYGRGFMTPKQEVAYLRSR